MDSSDELRKSIAPRRVDNIPSGLILFDGVCVLCSGWVQFIIARDEAAQFRFASIQGATGSAIARQLGIDPENPATNAVVLDGIAYFKSDSALAALSRLPHWRWTRVLKLLPRALRDWCYDRVARNRYRLFGRANTCFVPTLDQRARFLDL
jgi:predicted DCC family thiol-disulfide oxidoreductase YuxK